MNIRALLIPLAAIGFLCVPPLSADVDIEGPVLGYYVAPAGYALHAITGVAGSATLGPTLATDLDAVWLAPDNRTALGLRQGMIYLLRDIRDTTARLPLLQWTGPVDSVVWANDSSGALFYSSGRGILQIATSLPGTPLVSREIDVASLGGPILSLRLSGNPWSVALAIKGGETSAPGGAHSRRPANSAESLYLLTAAGSPVLVRGISRPGAMDFSGDAKSLYVVDGTANKLTRISVSSPESAEVVSLSSPELIPGDFTDLAVSPDGARIFVVDKKHQSACGFEINSGTTTFCSTLDFSPKGMTRLSGSLYLLDSTGDPTAPLWVLDGDPGRIFFVPLGGQR